ncbi:MAG: YdbL family protein [Magnetococcus sp. YQC-5]
MMKPYTNHSPFNQSGLGMHWVTMAVVMVSLAGCGGPLLEVTLVDERTALENQVLGNYAELNQEVLLLASVRGIDPQGHLIKKKPMAPNQKAVVRAMQRTAFNRDDLERFKLSGVIGENNQGGVTLLAPNKVEAKLKAFVANLVEEENADRLIIMARMIDTDEKLTEQDLPRIRAIVATMNRDRAPAGVMIQQQDGAWRPKE